MISSRVRYRAHNKQLSTLRRLRLQYLEASHTSTELTADNVALQFLVICNSSRSQQRATLNVIEHINGHREMLTRQALDTVMHAIAQWVMQERRDTCFITYIAHFFYRRQTLLQGIESMPPVNRDKINLSTTWLSWDAIRRNIIVPDIRKLALEIQWKREVRPGEPELIQDIKNIPSCSTYTVVQALRTVEFITNTRSGIMYCSLEDMYANHWLDSIVLAVIQTRMNSRVGLDWLKRCVMFEHNVVPRPESDAHIIVLARDIVVRKGNDVSRFEHATSAFHKWCQLTDNTIDGRYDVSITTI